ncbi:ABC transporter permease [Hansschlegelia plantiphila]|uniref:ABC transporter permease n=1 Tax=Hansschlegelia plantiphila TaxID=374655 RepID=A0A9W6MX65_9HYPH|nr:ABC transporter permease subunit [Hansschlegelia plantiphila]GLK69746.1 ABC transporter permease [Hansschlegelia plantiphila]
MRLRLEPAAVVWICVALLILWCETAGGGVAALHAFPKAWTLPIATWIGDAVAALIGPTQGFFRQITAALTLPLSALQAVLGGAPWVITTAVAVLLAFRAKGARLAAFTAAVAAYVLVGGYWAPTMNTLAAVALATPIAVLIGFGLGVIGYRHAAARHGILVLLDLMQTVPTFAYLIPILVLFGFGPVVGIIASAIYAIGPMANNTMLGLAQVPLAVREAGEMSGCTRRQLFWRVEFPSARSQLLVGVNQTVMAVFAMVIIAAVIGGADDIGFRVLQTMRQAQFGQGLLSGLVIALLAIVIDRTTAGFAAASRAPVRRLSSRTLTVIACALAALYVAAWLQPALDAFPTEWTYSPAEALNRWLLAFVARFGDVMIAIKNSAIFFLMLPLRIGLIKAVSPFGWGFTLTPAMIAGYWAVATIAAGAALLFGGRWRAAFAILGVAWMLFLGTTGVAWPGFVAVVAALAWQVGGARLGAFALAAMAFIAFSGSWGDAMQSLYLCALAVVICVAVGGALGVWAAENDHVSACLRPVLDTLQTIPQFVLLIPVLMLFQVGEFTALIAIVMYAIVPPIRYVEHGVRNVSPEVVEASRQMGCSRLQILRHVKLPMALPSIMLGLNQTILAALSMLAIAALVGTQGLAQAIYVALSKADVGKGLVAGLSIALIAMLSDRMLKAWSRRAQEALGS